MNGEKARIWKGVVTVDLKVLYKLLHRDWRKQQRTCHDVTI